MEQLNPKEVLTRRETAIKTGVFVAVTSGTILGAQLIRTILSETSKEKGLAKKRLVQEIQKLPPTPIKSLLLEHIVPYFETPHPTDVKLGGEIFKVQKTTIILRTVSQSRKYKGRFFLRKKDNFSKQEPRYPKQDTTLEIPILGLITPEEERTMQGGAIATDGTRLVQVKFPKGKPIYEGLSPTIIVESPSFDAANKNRRMIYDSFTKFTLIKEACSFLIYNLWIEETVRKMRERGLPTTIHSVDTKGGELQTEAVIQSLVAMQANRGRLLAAFDLAGYLLAVKALRNTESFTIISQEKKMVEVINLMLTTNIGTTSKKILYNSIEWAITERRARQLNHQGDINKIP